MNFNALHHQPRPLLIANVWDAGSALAAQRAGNHALGTSSAAIAAMLGYEDGEAMRFDELLNIVARISAVTKLPLSVDSNAGYGKTTNDIIDNIQRLAHLGVAGINLEDSRVVNGVRRISMGNFIYSAIQTQLKNLLCTVQRQHSFAGVFNHENHR
ncbi:isocitrate lyase/phosphoenolpyruvate mutase family protein [Acerihabitans sp. KWT182]|uniref:Isocitrate lyase/phosphoenolpyruvate mutase family protein n=1 Tax=Acerihabitans sp. KWT182 TaxID=3157919 RepID=A0AAU7Q876_9GAMM